MNNKMVYCGLILLSVVLILISMTFLSETIIAAPVLIVLSLYLSIGALIKLCKTNEKLKNTIICALDLLFWLP